MNNLTPAEVWSKFKSHPKMTIERCVQHLRQQGRFAGEGGSIPFTPINLIEEISEKIPFIKDRCVDSEICVLYTVEWAMWLVLKGFKNVTVVTRTYDPLIEKGVNSWSALGEICGFKYMSESEIGERKFDVVVGNPPYQEGDTGTNKNIFDSFYYLSNNLSNNYVVLISPTTWITSMKKSLATLRNFLHATGLYEVCLLNAQKIFGVNVDSLGITFQNTKNINNEHIITLLSGERITCRNNGDIITLTSNVHTLSIIQKAKNCYIKINACNSNIRSVGNDGVCGNGESSIKSTTEHPYKMINKVNGGVLEYAYTRVPKNLHKGKYRVAFSQLSSKTSLGTITILNDVESTTSRSVVYIPTETLIEAQNLKVFLNSKFFRFVLMNTRTNTLNAVGMLSTLPCVPLMQSLSDIELYEYFQLTQEEIDLIEKTVK